MVGKGRLKIKVEQCQKDTPKSIVELIRLCTEFDRDLRPDFARDVRISCLLFVYSNSNYFLFRLMIPYQNLNLSFHVYNVHNQSHV